MISEGSLFSYVVLSILIILLGLIIYGLVKRMKRFWIPSFISLILFLAAVFFITTISTESGVQKTVTIHSNE